MIKQSKPMDFKAIAKPYFDPNPTVNRYYFTSDGQPFELEVNAIAHARRLADATLTPVYRPELSRDEVKTLETAERGTQIAGREASFERVFPELARYIRQNAISRKG